MNRLSLAVAMLLALSAGCQWFEEEPPTYTVVRGDTLTRIAKAHDCSVDELRQWNGIKGDLIEVGQVLVVGERGGESPVVEQSAPARKRPARRAPRVRVEPDAGSGADPLVLPPEQPCLPGPEDAYENGMEAGFAASRGLDGVEVSSALSAFEPQLVRCLVAGEPLTGTMEFEVTVACTGRVAGVRLLDADGLPDRLTACVGDTLRFAAFPAHDMPDGFTFGYPVTVGP